MIGLVLAIAAIAGWTGWLLMRDRRHPHGHVLDAGYSNGWLWSVQIVREGDVVHRRLFAYRPVDLVRAWNEIAKVLEQVTQAINAGFRELTLRADEFRRHYLGRWDS